MSGESVPSNRGVSITGWSWRRQRQLVQEILEANRAVTKPQLLRWGLWEAAQDLGTQSLVLSGRMQVCQPSSLRDLTYVSLPGKLKGKAEPVVKHWAGMSELCWAMAGGYGVPHDWRLLNRRGRGGASLPDGELPRWCFSHTLALEIDCGYTPEVLRRKVRGMCAAGYLAICIGTTVHKRVAQLGEWIETWHAAGELYDLLSYDVFFVDFWSERDPYRPRPRNHKLNDKGRLLREVTIWDENPEWDYGRWIR